MNVDYIKPSFENIKRFIFDNMTPVQKNSHFLVRSVDIQNYAISINHTKDSNPNTIKLFKDRLKRALTYDIYVVYCNDYIKEGKEYKYNLNSFIIYYMSSVNVQQYLRDSNIALGQQDNNFDKIPYVIDIHKYGVILNNSINNSPKKEEKESEDFISQNSQFLTQGENLFDTKSVEEIQLERSNKDQLSSYTNLNKREYACILLKYPKSGTKWLDDLIKASKQYQLL